MIYVIWNGLDCLKQCNSSRKLLLYGAVLIVLGLEALFLLFAIAFYIVPCNGMKKVWSNSCERFRELLNDPFKTGT